MQYFNVRFSIMKFLNDYVGTPLGLRIFYNNPSQPGDETAMQAANAFLFVLIQPGEYQVDQPFDVVMTLHAKESYGKSIYWLQDIQRYIENACIHGDTHPENINLIAVYDFDSNIGAAAITTYLTTGAYPANIATLLAETTLPYRPNGWRTGLRVLPSTRQPVPSSAKDLLMLTWHETFKYYEPQHNRSEQG